MFYKQVLKPKGFCRLTKRNISVTMSGHERQLRHWCLPLQEEEQKLVSRWIIFQLSQKQTNKQTKEELLFFAEHECSLLAVQDVLEVRRNVEGGP